MLSEYKVGRSTRRCWHLDRPLQPGEWYYSVVSEDDDEGVLTRRDYSAEAWQGPPEGALGWWKCRMPAAGAKKLKLAPDAVLVDLLRQAGGDGSGEASAGAAIRYLLALLLMRRRVIRPVETAGAESDADDAMEFEVIGDGSTIRLTRCDVHPSQAHALGQQLTELLYCEAD